MINNFNQYGSKGLPIGKLGSKSANLGPLGALAITTGIDAIGQFFGNRSRKREARRQRQFDLDMWNRQNAYNTPAMQMQRLKDAGLNPALMYGQGTTGNAINQPKAQVPEIQNPVSSSGVASGIQLSLANAQKRLLDEQAEAQKMNSLANMMKAVSDKTRTTYQGRKLVYEINEMMARTVQQKTQALSNMQGIEESKSRISLNAITEQAKLADINLSNKQAIVAQKTAIKIQNDTKLQQRLIDEMNKGYGSGTLQTIGNLLGIDNVDSRDARLKIAGAILASTPIAKGLKWVKGLFTKKKLGYN